jgi:hypothetical protein
MSSTRSLWVIGGGVLALVIVAIGAVILVGDRATPTIPADSPEGTIQRYLDAWEADDMAAAHGYFSTDVMGRMDLAAFERARDEWEEYAPSSTDERVLLSSSRIDGDTAVVTVTIEQFSGDGLGASSYRYDSDIHLVREDGAWRIDEPLVWLDVAPIEPAFPTGD